MFRPLIAAAALTAASAVAAQAECQTVRFAPGTYSAQVATTSYHGLTQCFFLDVRAGQGARVRIVAGSDTTFFTPETGPDQIDTSFLLYSDLLEVYLQKSSPVPHSEPVIVEFTVR